MTIYLNGKFTAQHMTGVQRTASCLVQALDAWLGQREGAEPWVLLCPPGAPVPALRHIQVRQVGPRGLPLGVWEQTVLPLAACLGRLVSLSGSAPLLGRAQSNMLHDAAVFDHPQAYTWAFRHWYRLLFRRLARRSRQLFTVSAFSQQRLSARLDLPPGRLQVLPNGGDHLRRVAADHDAPARLGLDGRPYLLVVGSANPNKNVGLVEAVFRRLPAASELRLVVVGGLNRRVFARQSAEETWSEDRVLRLGPVSDPVLKALIQQACFLVFPSRYEGFGLPALEAMACGCPVLAARTGAIPEVCGDAALYFDPASAADLERTLAWMVCDRGLRDRLRIQGSARAGRFVWQDSAARLWAAVTGEPLPEGRAEQGPAGIATLTGNAPAARGQAGTVWPERRLAGEPQ
ncbi:glycosyltransferase family 4 protein [Ideonella livida]|uniref:Glycosyltransferase family 4 protein n=1 Tax=Ideonella livida TaxID=2707176 RepID=A0A7C9PH49_9BURK|nr:glycosyltransferase family 1 protein [Ideonella livida]NDY91628.1 glycosyltransferase family 4 protein [Ideonella livida]